MRKLIYVVLLACGAFAQPYRDLIGTGIGGHLEGSGGRMFVDIAKGHRPPSKVAGGNATVDANGWPTEDFSTVLFDVRPCCPWIASDPGPDDPDRFTPDLSGDYAMSFNGQANVESSGGSIENLVYDPDTNTSRGILRVPREAHLVVLTFTSTKRSADGGPGTGITNLRIIRPGYAADTTKIFTDEFLDALRPFRVLRFMGFLSTNDADYNWGAPGSIYPAQKEWFDRKLPNHATQQDWGGKRGIAWEYVIDIANLTGKDIWINIPVSASDDYIFQLARLIKDRLRAGTKIYLEHGNEVWNPIFSTQLWNSAAAQADDSVKTNPAQSTRTFWEARRHAKRTARIGQIFREVYGQTAHSIIRPVFAWWTGGFKLTEWRDALIWLRNNVGEPKDLLWGMAQTHYFNDEGARRANVTVEQVLAAMRANSDGGVSIARDLHQIARDFGLQHVTYEAGPDNGGGNTAGINNRIRANRDPRMKDLLIHDMRDNWFNLAPGEYGLYMHLEVMSSFTRYGAWGLAEDAKLLDTPKYNASKELFGTVLIPAIGGIADTSSARAFATPGGFLSIYGQNFAGGDNQWTAVGGVLPTELAGVRVVVNGKPAHVQYAGPGQVNVLLPADITGDELTVEVTGPGGVSTMKLPVQRNAPGFFGHSMNGKFYASALHANSAVYVAAEGALPTAPSRPAKKDDFVELYVSGLPVPGEAPAGRVLERDYPIDTSGIRVTVDGQEAQVVYAGLRFAGVFQVNIRIPEVARSGDVPIVLSYGGRETQPASITVAQ